MNLKYSDSKGSMLTFVLPKIQEVGRYSFTVAFGASASAMRSFAFFDSRVSIACTNAASMLEGCHGSMQGGDVLDVTIDNFGKITSLEQLEIFLGERISHVVSIVSSTMEFTLSLIHI